MKRKKEQKPKKPAEAKGLRIVTAGAIKRGIVRK